MTQARPRVGARSTGARRFGARSLAIMALTVATALIHVALAFALDFDKLFLANGLGYLALLAALYAPIPALAPYRRYARWALLIYAAVTVVMWLLIGARTPVAYVDKLIEVSLIGLLWAEEQAARR